MDKIKEFVANHKLPVIIGGVALVFVIILLIVVGSASKGGGAAAPISSGVEGLIRVGIIPGNDQYAAKNGDELTGIEPRIAEIAAELEGVTLETSLFATVEQGVSALQAGSIDILMGRIAETCPDVKGMAMSSPYGWSGLYFLAPRNDFTDNLAQMGGKQIGILSVVATTAQTIPYVEGVVSTPYADLSQLAQDVTEGKISLGVVSERDAIAMVSENLQAQEILDGPQENYVAVATGGTIHLAAVNAAVGKYFDELAAEE